MHPDYLKPFSLGFLLGVGLAFVVQLYVMAFTF